MITLKDFENFEKYKALIIELSHIRETGIEFDERGQLIIYTELTLAQINKDEDHDDKQDLRYKEIIIELSYQSYASIEFDENNNNQVIIYTNLKEDENRNLIILDELC